MIRLTLFSALTLFVAVGILSYFEGAPGAQSDAAINPLDAAVDEASVAVTRARTDTLSPAPAAPAPAPADEMASLTAGIVANIRGGATLPAPPAAEASPAPALAPGTDMDALTGSVLASLRAARIAGADKDQPLDLKSLIAQSMEQTSGDSYVQALLEAAKPDVAAQADAPLGDSDVSTLLREALLSGANDVEIDTLLNDAVASGRVEVPGALRTAEGRFDTQTLLTDLVQRSTGTLGTPRTPRIEDLAGVDGIEVAEVEQSGQIVDAVVYVVQSGDSLGAIAQRFYGDAAQYSSIYQANRRVLSSPNQIRIGQRLILPDPSA